MFSKTATLGLIAKIVLLASATAVLGFMAYFAFLAGEWIIGAVLTAVLLLANYIYLSKRAVASKFFFPGLVFLAIFVVVPVLYTTLMSGFNYKTGNEIDKADAIEQLYSVGLQPALSGETYDMVVGESSGSYQALLTEQSTREVLLGTKDGLEALAPGSYEVDETGKAISVEGFTPVDVENASNIDAILAKLVYKFEDGTFISAQGYDLAAKMEQIYVYDSAKGTLTDTSTGFVWVDNGNGNFANPDDPEEMLYPGWREFNPAGNYIGLLTDPKLQGPFISVFIWTFAFAFITVIMMFGVGFFLAVTLDKKMRGRNFYRAVLILPYAMPSFMSILIWAGMFDREIGIINNLLGAEIDWLNDPWLAKMALLIVNLWLGFPYFYLISTGALQALPTDMEEAAAIDGATGAQIFWRIKLPLVLEILTPLLIASFAFNFNNFNLVFLLTRGGPVNVLDGESAGATDILITYAYKTAFAGTEQNYGLASAISVIVFIIVGAVSLWGLKRSKVLENIQ